MSELKRKDHTNTHHVIVPTSIKRQKQTDEIQDYQYKDYQTFRLGFHSKTYRIKSHRLITVQNTLHCPITNYPYTVHSM